MRIKSLIKISVLLLISFMFINCNLNVDDNVLDDLNQGNGELTYGACGDGVQNKGESCDDGNTVSGDGCSDICLSEDFTGLGAEAGFWTSGCQIDTWDEWDQATNSYVPVYRSRDTTLYFDGTTFIYEELEWYADACGAKGTQHSGHRVRGDYTISSTTKTALGLNVTYDWDNVTNTDIVQAFLSGGSYNAYDLDVTFRSVDIFTDDTTQITDINTDFPTECGGNFVVLKWNAVDETCANVLFMKDGQYDGPELNKTMLMIMSIDGGVLKMGADYNLNGDRIDTYTTRQEYINDDDSMTKVN
ncbi:MAG: hypothetical protein OEZ22_08730 [Spirochaetia bacterium]|nr:hypothetical protein [Spirochaetia bacterium]